MTDGLAYLAAIALAAVLAYSAATKLRDLRPTRRALDAAHIPASGVIAKSIPVVEAITAGVLLTVPTVGGVMAAALLGALTSFVVHLLAKGIDVSCGCFGANATESVSSVDVVRNVFLIALAGIAVSAAGPSAMHLEDVIAATTSLAIGTVVLTAMATRHRLGQLFDNRLPGDR